jgi:hypothetical protein
LGSRLDRTAHARKDPTAHSRYVANQACALFFLLPTCSPWKAFETWGSAPQTPHLAAGLFFCPLPRTRGKKAGQKGGKEEKKERWTKVEKR